jgi:hypothetical protein
MEDWSFLDTDDCSLWLADEQSGQHIYKIPLGKLRTRIEIGNACGNNTCPASMELTTANNQKAIKHLTLYFSQELNSGSYKLVNESQVYVSLSSEHVIRQAIRDISVGIKACAP